MTVLSPAMPTSVGLLNADSEAVSRDAPLYVSNVSLIAVPWRQDRISTVVTGSAFAWVGAPEDFTSSSVDNLIVDDTHTALMMTVYPYSTNPGTGSYAGTPAANGAVVDFDFFGTALGFAQVLYSSVIGNVSDEISCRIDGIAHPLDEVLPILPGYNSPDPSAQVRHLIAATDLLRTWHHCTLAVLSDPSQVTELWLSEILLEPNEINQMMPRASIWPRAASLALNNATFTSMTPRTGTPMTQGFGFTRVAFVNTTGNAVTVQWRAHMANGQVVANPDIVTVQANDTRWIDAPYGSVWTQVIEAMASVSSGVFMRGEIAR